MLDHLDLEQITIFRKKYNNFRKMYLINNNLYKKNINLNNISKLNYIRNEYRDIRLLKCKNKNIILEQQLFEDDKFDNFNKYKNSTLYVCEICLQNVYVIKKIKLKCNHFLCYDCDRIMINDHSRDYKCPFCRTIIIKRIRNNNYNNNNQNNINSGDNNLLYFNNIIFGYIFVDTTLILKKGFIICSSVLLFGFLIFIIISFL